MVGQYPALSPLHHVRDVLANVRLGHSNAIVLSKEPKRRSDRTARSPEAGIAKRHDAESGVVWRARAARHIAPPAVGFLILQEPPGEFAQRVCGCRDPGQRAECQSTTSNVVVGVSEEITDRAIRLDQGIPPNNRLLDGGVECCDPRSA